MSAATEWTQERPILFKPELVRATLDGRKDVTRRIVKPQPANGCHYVINEAQNGACHLATEAWEAKDFDRCYVPPTAKSESHVLPCPYGKPGDRLWVRETWRRDDYDDNQFIYMADGPEDAVAETRGIIRWRPSIFMPREACRLRLSIVSIGVERIQEISMEDIQREGVLPVENGDHANQYWREETLHEFAEGWDRINAKRGYSWDSNPFVWVISFRKVD